MSSTPTLSVNNVLSFNGHGGKVISDGDKTFTLPDNVYVLVPFGIGVDDVKKPDGYGTQKTDKNFKGLDVCYGFPPPQAKGVNEQSFEDIIYGEPGKLKLTFNNGSSNVDAKWYLYKPGDNVPNVNYFPWKSSGDTAAPAAASCQVVSTKYDSFVKDLMNACLNSSDVLNKKVCAYFVSDSTKTTKDDQGKTTSEVLTDNKDNRHLKLKICGDAKSATTTLKELAENCRDLVKFSKDFVLKNNGTGTTYDGYKDDNIFPKSGPTDPIILLPFSCNSCGPTDDIALSHTNAGDALVEPLSKIIAELAGGGDGAPVKSSDPIVSEKVAQFFMTFDDGSNGGLNSDKQAQKIINVVKCLIAKGYKHIGLTYSANQAQTEQIFSDYKYNKDSPGNTFADGEEKVISSQILDGTHQANVLTKLNTKISSDASYSEFKKAFRVIPFTTMRYENQGTPPKEVGVDLDASKPGNNNECIEAAKAFLQLPLPDSIILGWCNQDCGNMNDTTDTKQKFAIGGGVAKSLNNANKLYIPQYLQFLESKWDEDVQKIVTQCSPDPKSVDSPVSPPPEAPPSSPVEKKPFDNVLKELEGALTRDSENDAEINKLGITLPADFLYPLNGNDADKKNLNSTEPAIGDMIAAFETAVDGDDTKFYLGACRSIQAAYVLEKGDKKDGSAEAMRAKLLLNLRKNSLLLKVPARWDYATMQPGEEPELTEEEVTAKYEELQQKCAKLTKSSGHDNNYNTEKAYELAVELIPLDEKMEIDKLQKKIELYEKYLPKSELTYKPINIKEGFTCEVPQSNNNCGRAALSNFFGDENKFTKGFTDGTEQSMQNEINSLSPYDLASPRPDVINLGQICKLSQIFDSFVDASSSEETTKCRTDEDYSYMVLSLALQICGFYKFDIPSVANGDDKPNEKKKIDDKLMMCVNNKYVVGFIVLQSKSHWVNYKRVNIGSTGDSFYFINSGDCEEKQKNNTYEKTELLKLIYSYHKTSNKITKVIPIIRTTDDVSELQNSEKQRNVAFDSFKIANSSMTPKQLVHEFKSEYLPYACQEVTNIQIWEDNSRFEIEANKILIHSNQNNYKWKLFLKEVTSNIQSKDTYKSDEEKLKVMFYLSNFPSEIISVDLKQQILNSNESVKATITQIFVDDTKDNINKITIKTNSGPELETDLEIVNKKLDYITLVPNSDGVNNFTPTFDAKERFYYNLNNNNKRYNNQNIDKLKSAINYNDLINALKKKVETALSSLPDSSSSVGGSKPAHNTTTTNHAAFKSKHNSSFKASSSKTKGKGHNRSHTQRVK